MLHIGSRTNPAGLPRPPSASVCTPRCCLFVRTRRRHTGLSDTTAQIKAVPPSFSPLPLFPPFSPALELTRPWRWGKRGEHRSVGLNNGSQIRSGGGVKNSILFQIYRPIHVACRHGVS